MDARKGEDDIRNFKYVLDFEDFAGRIRDATGTRKRFFLCSNLSAHFASTKPNGPYDRILFRTVRKVRGYPAKKLGVEIQVEREESEIRRHKDLIMKAFLQMLVMRKEEVLSHQDINPVNTYYKNADFQKEGYFLVENPLYGKNSPTAVCPEVDALFDGDSESESSEVDALFDGDSESESSEEEGECSRFELEKKRRESFESCMEKANSLFDGDSDSGCSEGEGGGGPHSELGSKRKNESELEDLRGQLTKEKKRARKAENEHGELMQRFKKQELVSKERSGREKRLAARIKALETDLKANGEIKDAIVKLSARACANYEIVNAKNKLLTERNLKLEQENKKLRMQSGTKEKKSLNDFLSVDFLPFDSRQ